MAKEIDEQVAGSPTETLFHGQDRNRSGVWGPCKANQSPVFRLRRLGFVDCIFHDAREVERVNFCADAVWRGFTGQNFDAACLRRWKLMAIENEGGEGCTVIYDLPSSLMVTEENPPLLEAAQALDRKLQALVSRATGISQAKVLRFIARRDRPIHAHTTLHANL